MQLVVILNAVSLIYSQHYWITQSVYAPWPQ